MVNQLKKGLKISLIAFLISVFLLCAANFGISIYKNLGVANAETNDLSEFLAFESAVVELNKNNNIQIDRKESIGQDEQFQDDEISEQEEQDTSEFKLKRLIVTGTLKENYGAISEVGYKDVHILVYPSEQATQNAYEQLIKDDSLNVVIDQYHKIESYADEEYNYTTGYKNWGAEAIDIGGYRKFLSDNDVDKEVVVVVMDTGLNTSHEMFANRLIKVSGKVKGYSYFNSPYQYSYGNLAFDIDDTNKYSFEDDQGHGTHVAGIICDLTPSNVKILPIKIGDPQNDNKSSDSIMISAYLRVLNVYSEKYNVVCTNLSYSGGGKSSESSRDTYNETCYNPLREKNILSVTAAGNDSEQMDIEGLNAVVVSALTKDGKGYTFDQSYSNYGKIIDIAAPGSAINSAWINSTNGANSKIYSTIQGTSMASPQVAGAVALLYLNPRFPTSTTAAEIEEKLYEYSLDMGEPGKDDLYGHGLANLRYFEVKETQTLSFYYNNMIINDYYNYHLFEDAFKLRISCPDEDFTIIYTTDNSIPNIKNCIIYNTQLDVSNTSFFYVIGVKVVGGKIVERTNLYNISFFYAKTPMEECFVIDSFGRVEKYIGKYTEIVMPEYINGIQVESLAPSLFKRMNVVSVTFPESCKSMAGYVFLGCKNLKYVYAPGIEKIYISGFYGSSIPFVTDENPTAGATEGCYFPALTDVIGTTFACCENLRSVKLSKVKFDEEDKGWDFSDCINLTQAEFANAEYLPTRLFNNCPKLESFTIGKNVSSIGDGVFAKNKLKNIYVESGNRYFYSDKNLALYYGSSIIAFASGYTGDYDICSTALIDGVNKPINRIGDAIFIGCNLNSLSIPTTITTIGKEIAMESTIKNLYYNAKKITNKEYKVDGGYFSLFTDAYIDNLVIGSDVQVVPEILFRHSFQKNITIESSKTTYETQSLYIYDKAAGLKAPYNLYLTFDESVGSAWISTINQSNVFISLGVLYAKTKLAVSNISYTQLNYLGKDDGWHVYGKGSMVTTSVNGDGQIDPSGDVAILVGQSKTFNIIPGEGQMIVDVKVNGVSVGPVESYTFNIDSESALNQTISAEFALDGTFFLIVATAGFGGTIEPEGERSYRKNTSPTFKITPKDSTYVISDVLVDGVSVGKVSEYTFERITSGHTIEAVFERIKLTIIASSGGNGQISPSGSQQVDYAGVQTFTFTPDEEYVIEKILVDGSPIGKYELEYAKTYGYTFRNVTQNHTISVYFTRKLYELKFVLEQYGLSNITQNYYKGETITLPQTPYISDYYYFKGWYDEAEFLTLHEFSTMLGESFVVYGCLKEKEYNITAQCNSYGTVSPMQSVITILSMGIINIEPENGYKVSEIKVDGRMISAQEIVDANKNGAFRFNISKYHYNLKDSPSEDHTVYVKFAPIPYKLILNYNYENSQNQEIEFDSFEAIEMPKDPERKGYAFGGWYNDISCTNAFNLTTMPTNDVTVYAKWTINTYTLIATCGENGAITPSGTTVINYGEKKVYNFTPNDGYHIGLILIDNESLRGPDFTDAVLFGYSFENVSANHTIHVEYALNVYSLSITKEGGDGEIVADKDILNIKHGDSVTLTINADYNAVKPIVYVDGEQRTIVDGKIVVSNITKDIKVKVDFVGKGFLETTLGKIIVIGSVVAVVGLIVAIKLIKKSRLKKLESSNSKIFDMLKLK